MVKKSVSDESFFYQKIISSSVILSREEYEDPTNCFPMADDKRRTMRTCRCCRSLYDIDAQPESCTFHMSFFRVIIPARYKGLVIGKGGSRIKEIRKVSKVFIVPVPTEEPEFRLQGTPQAIDKAFSMICQTLTGKGSVDGSWDCCKRNTTARGCTSEIGHDTKTRYPVLGNKAGCFTSETGHKSKTRHPDKAMVVTTKPKARPGKVFALDCEMVDTEIGKEVVIVTMLNFAGETCLESLVKPSARIMDYKTQYSGMTPEKLERATATLKDVQKSLLDLVSADDVLVGHSIDKDLRALHLEHRQVTKKKAAFIQFVARLQTLPESSNTKTGKSTTS